MVKKNSVVILSGCQYFSSRTVLNNTDPKTIGRIGIERKPARLRQFPAVNFYTDYVCLDLSIYRHAPEPLGDSFGSDVGCFAKPRGILCLDLVPQFIADLS